MLRTQFIRSTRIPIRAVMATRGVADNAGRIPFPRSPDVLAADSTAALTLL